MPPLDDLIARLEKAEGPSRELDALVWCAKNRATFHHVSSSGWLTYDNASGIGCSVGMGDVPRYTASFDAAIHLVPRDCEWEVGSAKLLGVYWARLISAAEQYIGKNAKTPALALVIAALRAANGK